ncbi:asparagine-linked glycosylation protein [Microbotryomycetes sp. JL221]|nr:asparagine-linked glycosylation protein [Microbotryomycetes sp. JL221]
MKKSTQLLSRSVARDHLALERTYLAWLRTSLALASIGIAITQLFRLPSSTTVPSDTATVAQALQTQVSDVINSTAVAESSIVQLEAIMALLVEQSNQIDILKQQVNDPLKYRHLGKPIGGTFIALALLFLVLGSTRYFVCQAALMLEPQSMFPPSRRSVIFSASCVARLGGMHPFIEGALALPPHIKLLLIVPAGVLGVSCLSSLIVIAAAMYGWHIRRRNDVRRRILLRQIGIEEFDKAHRVTVVGFFHPFCNAGGGGERVLWAAIKALQDHDTSVVSVVYTGDAVRTLKADVLDRVKNRFDIELNAQAIFFVPLKTRYLVEDKTWPRLTLLGQSIGSVILALEGLTKGCIPDVWIDTMGYAFAYPLVNALCKVPVGSYTHYPTISIDMLRRVQSREIGHTNAAAVAHSSVLSTVKLIYYIIFAELYSFCLRRANVLMVNSTWTKNHIDHLLKPFGYRDDVEEHDEAQSSKCDSTRVTGNASDRPEQHSSLRQRPTTASTTPPAPLQSHSAPSSPRYKRSTILYPPCDTVALSQLPIEARESIILSVAQFRPEKEHEVQLKAFKLLLDSLSDQQEAVDDLRLILAGSVRDEADELRVDRLKVLAQELGIHHKVSFVVNASFTSLIELFGKASIGLHTMVDEHFGITVVEFQAAGLIPLVHASAGPLLDICVPYDGQPTGFHAKTTEEFAEKMRGILELDRDSVKQMRRRARLNAVERFSTKEFETGWLTAWNTLIEGF